MQRTSGESVGWLDCCGDDLVIQAYANYAGWKGWCEDNADNRFAREAYEAEFSRSEIKPDSRILEIGFGNGGFLNWARDRGHAVVGLEIIGELVSRARNRGHEAYEGHPHRLLPDQQSKFDLICMFDVLEHIERHQIPAYLGACASLLRAGGRMLLRFPNGRSPFGVFVQHGDATHVSVLSAAIVGQIAEPFGVRVISARNAFRTSRSGGVSGWKKRIAYWVRDLVELAVSLIYTGQRIPLDSTVIVTLEKI